MDLLRKSRPVKHKPKAVVAEVVVCLSLVVHGRWKQDDISDFFWNYGYGLCSIK